MMAISALKKKLNHCIDEETVPVLVKNECLAKLTDISNDIKSRMKENLRYLFVSLVVSYKFIQYFVEISLK